MTKSPEEQTTNTEMESLQWIHAINLDILSRDFIILSHVTELRLHAIGQNQ